MFHKSRKDQVVEQTSDATTYVRDQLRDKVVPAVGHAAGSTRDWAAPRVVAAKEWAAPRAQKGLDAAAPRLEQAVDVVSPKIDAARDKLVDDVLPKLVDAINAATSQAAAARDEATSRGSDAVAVLKGDAVAKPKRRRGRKLLMLGGLLAGVGAAVAAFRRKSEDPWASSMDTTPTWASSTPSTSSAPGTASSAAADRADDTIDVTAVEQADAANQDLPAEVTDLGSAQDDASTPDGDQPGKITPKPAARKAKAREDG